MERPVVEPAHRSRDHWMLAGLWLAATACNVAEPFHVDDAAHLLIAC